MRRTKKKKFHITFYDRELARKINKVKKAEGITYDELLKQYLKLPEDVLELVQRQHQDNARQLAEEYKKEKLIELMGFMWILISKSAIGEYDIDKIISIMEADIRMKKLVKK